MKNRIPLWISILSTFIALLGIVVGFSLYLTPGTFIQDVDFTTSGTRYLANMWAARQIALALIIGFSTLKKSIPMLQISLAAYSVMNAQDVMIGIGRGDQGLIFGAILFMAGPAFMVYRLSKVAKE